MDTNNISVIEDDATAKAAPVETETAEIVEESAAYEVMLLQGSVY
ncbi:hypothetical protein [Actinoplanes sp. RD1]|nr:hypothetical protein [Actinoplanes sp. RD1]